MYLTLTEGTYWQTSFTLSKNRTQRNLSNPDLSGPREETELGGISDQTSFDFFYTKNKQRCFTNDTEQKKKQKRYQSMNPNKDDYS